MKFNIIANESLKANAYALFFVKKSVQFSSILSENGEKQVESVLNGMKDGPFEDLEFLEIDGKPTFFVDAAKERGISALDHLRMAAYRLAERAQKKQVPTVSIFLADAADEQFKAILHGLFYADYRFDAYKSKQEPKFQVTFEIVAGEHVKDFKKIAEDVAIEQKAVTLARNLINTCASDLYPAEFVENAKTIAKYTPGLSIKVRDMKQLQKEGFMGHVTVGKGQLARTLHDYAVLRRNEGRQAHLEGPPRNRWQGAHVRYRRTLPQAAQIHARDDQRHERCGNSARRHPGNRNT